MSKVLFLVNHDVVIYNFRLELVECLLADGHQVVISSPYGERIEDLKALGCEYREIDIARHGMNPIKELKLISEYKKLLDQVKPDIVFSYTIKPNIYGSIACRSRKVPCVTNITGLGTAVENGGLVQKITVLLYKYAFTKVQRVFFQNTENMQFFVDHKIALGKHDLLPGSGVNLQRFEVLEYPETDTVEFAFISRIMKEKGIDQYLEAAEFIRSKYPNTVFHVCGFCEDAYEDKLKELTDKGIINYHGMVRDIKAFLKGIHCTIHPTYYPEGLSNVLLESSACARPIITTDRSGCREVIDDGVNGYVVKQQDCQDLIEKIEKFLKLSVYERKVMGLAGRAKVERAFDRQIVVEKYIREIDNL
ncbi:MAG: glycosyltransferase family 4 protein [Clostridia bacterium]|nr:glycosyltransferase family 4 protein [Clostridia bacterium]